MKTLRTVLLTIFFMALLTVIACRSYLEEVIPVSIDKRAIEYAIVDPDDFGLITSLADAKRVKIEIVLNHRDMQISLKRLAEDDNLAHGDALGFINNPIIIGEANLDLLIGDETNPFSLTGILMMAGLGSGGLIVGKKYFESDKEKIRKHDEKVKNGSTA